MGYMLHTEEPGPRGVETAAHGLVMVAPQATKPAKGEDYATVGPFNLTDEEVKRAEQQGIVVTEQKDAEAPAQSSNLPAAGQIDPNAPKVVREGGSKDKVRKSVRGEKAKAEKADAGGGKTTDGKTTDGKAGGDTK